MNNAVNKINYIFVHHTGGYENFPFASSKNLTLEQIDEAHKKRWPNFKSQLGYWVGYTIVIFPDGKMIQTRLIGEETAQTKGYNSSSIGICLLGNFNKGVDTPTQQQVETLKIALQHLYNKNPELIGLQVEQGTEIDIPLQSVLPHRAVSQTECYGTALDDKWAQNLLVPVIQEKISLLQRLISLYTQLIGLLKTKPIGSIKVACWEMDNKD